MFQYNVCFEIKIFVEYFLAGLLAESRNPPLLFTILVVCTVLFISSSHMRISIFAPSRQLEKIMRHFCLIGAKTGFRSNGTFARMGLHPFFLAGAIERKSKYACANSI